VFTSYRPQGPVVKVVVYLSPLEARLLNAQARAMGFADLAEMLRRDLRNRAGDLAVPLEADEFGIDPRPYSRLERARDHRQAKAVRRQLGDRYDAWRAELDRLSGRPPSDSPAPRSG